jgi:plasmid stability protein
MLSLVYMSQLLVRKVDPQTVQMLKARANAHGVSTEEEHRRILREALSRPENEKPSLIEFLSRTAVAPDVDLKIERSHEIEERDTGF